MDGVRIHIRSTNLDCKLSQVHLLSRSKNRPEWVDELLAAFRTGLGQGGPGLRSHMKSDQVLERIRPALVSAGYVVERGKKRDEKIHRPVLFGEMGETEVEYQIDAFHPDHKIVVEVEAGRGGKGNAVFRDIIRMSLMVDAEFGVIAVPVAYVHNQRVRGTQTPKEVEVPAYGDAKHLLDAIYSSGRLPLPFKGMLLIGY